MLSSQTLICTSRNLEDINKNAIEIYAVDDSVHPSSQAASVQDSLQGVQGYLVNYKRKYKNNSIQSRFTNSDALYFRFLTSDRK